MMNHVRNAVFLATLVFVIFAFGIVWKVLTPFAENTYTLTNNVAPNALTDNMYLSYLSMKSLMYISFYSIASLLIFLVLVSSMLDVSSLQSWLINAFAGLILTPIMIYLITSFWNGIVLTGIAFADINAAFITNMPTIFLINLVIGMLSFVFIRRGTS